MTADRISQAVAARVRANVLPALIAAVLLIYFGFFHLARPSATDLFGLSALVFYHTLRWGGIAMAVVAAWSLTGRRHALLVDAVVSWSIGGLLILTGIGMFVDGGGGLQSVLNVVFGVMFLSAGTHNGRAFSGMPGSAPKQPDRAMVLPTPSESGEESWLGALKPSSAHRKPETAAESGLRESPAEPPDTAPFEPEGDSIAACDDAQPAKAPPGGFLASFAPDSPPRQG